MFERYTEKARRIIFFARYEASQLGSHYIETEHLLLGLLREDKALTNRLLHRLASVESIRKQVEHRTVIGKQISTTVDLPLTDECKRVLAYAAEEADRLSHKHIGTEHLLLGLLREENCFAAQLLKERGVEISGVREEIARSGVDPGRYSLTTRAASSFRDLTEAAVQGELQPVLGREAEVDALVAIVSSRYRRSAVLVGERGVGKTAIIEALAQCIAGDHPPAFLGGKSILAFDSTTVAGNPTKPAASIDDLTSLVRILGSTSLDAIVFVEDLFALLAAIGQSGLPIHSAILRQQILSDQRQYLTACTPKEYNEAIGANSWLEACFRPVYVRSLDEESTLAVLRARKGTLEQFHNVLYADEALAFAAHSCSASGGALPGSAIELLDAAGALAQLRQPQLPPDVAEVNGRISVITKRIESAIQNHEFEKARFYSEEERKERDNLCALSEQYHLEPSVQGTVGREILEEVLAMWAKYPYVP